METARDFGLTGGIKRFYLEPARLPVFRNAPSLALHPEADWWNEHRQLPVPTIPLVEDPAWILLNGAIHPRNDREALLPAGRATTLRVVVESHLPSPPKIGLRSGFSPARVSGTLAGHELTLDLPPHSQRLVDLPLSSPEKIIRAHGPHPETRVYRMDLRAGPGDVWLTVLEDARAESMYLRFGPDPEPQAYPDPGETARQLLAESRYLEFDRLHPRPQAPPALTDRPLALAAGRYTLTLRVLNPKPEDARLEVALTDNAGLAPRLSSGTLLVPPGSHSIPWTFEKPFLPYQVNTEVHLSENARFESASLKPEFTDRRPADPPVSPLEFHPFAIEYANGVRLTGVHAPDPPRPGQPFRHAVRAEAWDATPRVMAETLVFLHLVDAKGNLVKALDFPLIAGSFDEDRPNPRETLMPDDLPEGPLFLDVGLHTPRTRLREKPRTVDAPNLEGKPARRAVRIHGF